MFPSFFYKETLEWVFTQRIGKLFETSPIATGQLWDGPFLHELQVEIRKLCFLFHLDFNVLCVKTIHGSKRVQMFSGCVDEYTLQTTEARGMCFDNSNIFDDKWMQAKAHKDSCKYLVQFRPIFLNNTADHVQARLQKCLQSDSALTVLLIVNRDQTGADSPFILPLLGGKAGSSFGSAQFNEAIQDRVRAAIAVGAQKAPRNRVTPPNTGGGGPNTGGGGPNTGGGDPVPTASKRTASKRKR